MKNEECVSLDSSVIFEWSGGFHSVVKVANKDDFDDFDNCANGDVKSSSGIQGHCPSMRVEKLGQKLNLDGHLGLFLLRIVSVMCMKLLYLLCVIHCV